MNSKEQGFEQLKQLVERFGEQIDSYKSGYYNETLTRRDFIDPFFKALGWDMDNSQGYAEAYREVIHEDKVKVGKATKAPDYSFSLPGGKRLFFVEAKKPSVDIKGGILAAYQIRRYGWNAKLPVSIVTDFEELSVYDCTKKPNPTDKASISRIKYLTYDKYLNEFDYLWSTFSKEQVLKGSFDRYVRSDTDKKGTATVDKEFLISLDIWRTYLATSISLKNKQLDEDEINFAVQQTIDRLIFLRIAEDRGVEPYGQLKASVMTKGDAYQNLLFNFKNADEKYNSGLFDFKKDAISETLIIDNKVIKTIVNEMYFPCPYVFSEIPIEILGSAYEQFLGKQIKIDAGHRAKIEEKPEVRKAGGVFYTPQYVVDYIVENTVGKLITGKTPKQIEKIKILDPACGSGSFLIGAYSFLIDYHRNYYTENGIISGKKDSPTTNEGNLTSAEKKRILLNNIYGVDIDVNAVEVTKLSLLLKCMEGETETSLAQQFKLWHNRILPTLDNNIKSGNSLVDTDYYDGQIDFEPGLEKKIKPFNWQSAFPEVFNRDFTEPKNELKQLAQKAKEHARKAMEYASELEDKLNFCEPTKNYGSKIKSGFDVIIGNPPYVMLQNLETREVFDYSLKKFESAKYKIDNYQLFIEASTKLLKENGYLSFITPNTFLKNVHSEPLRRYLLNKTTISEILLFNYSVFNAASVDTCILFVQKTDSISNSIVSIKQANTAFEPEKISEILQLLFLNNKRADFNLNVTSYDTDLLNNIQAKSDILGNLCNAYFGIQTYDRKKYVSKLEVNSNYEPVIDGANINAYFLKPSSDFVNYIPEAIKSGGSEIVYRQERICIRQIGNFPIATIVPANLFTLNTIYNVYLKQKDIADLRFLLGFINSNLVHYYWKKNNSDEKKTFPKIKKEAILAIPIKTIQNENEQSIRDEIIKNVSGILKLNEELQNTRLPDKIELLNTRIEHTHKRINYLVYKLYNLSENEIEIVEADINIKVK